MDIVGPLPTAPGNYTHAVVIVEYFSKWVEAKPLLSITSATIQKCFWQNIVCRFGVPYEVTVDNGKQFDSADFKDFCAYLGTKLCFASVYNPQSNGAVEWANGIISADIKRNITELPKSKWAEELPRVIWSHNTTTSRTTQFSPFKLLYGEEAMLPEELCLGTWRDIPSTDEALETSVQNIEEVRLQAGTNLLSYQEETRTWKNKKIRPKSI
jgi:transposase InsO family protein